MGQRLVTIRALHFLPDVPIPLVPSAHPRIAPGLAATGRAPLTLALAGLLLASATHVAAQVPLQDDGGLRVLPAAVRIGVERIRLPGNEQMGLVGTSNLLQVAPGVSMGPAAYAAISGRRGGFFTVGVEAAWHRRLVGPLGIEAGFYAGGGGGGAAPVGGGLMLRPHVDLLWDLGGYRAGVSLSQVRFANGAINSQQLGLVWSTGTDFRYLLPDRIGPRSSASSSVGGRTGIGFDRVQAVAGVYRPRGKATRLSGGPLPARIGLVGIRLERALSDNAYWGVEAAGAGSGSVAGYAEYLATVGTERAVWGDRLTLGGRVALGLGGGGDIGVGGGLLAKAAVYGIVRLSHDLGLSLEGGTTRAPQGSFRALHGSVALNWILDDPGDPSAGSHSTRTEWVAGVSRYQAARKDGTQRELDAVTLKINRFVSSSVYLSGQAHSAFGGGAGGYSVGLFGVGVQMPVATGWRIGAEALAGAAGGGGVDTRGGTLLQPMAYVDTDLGRSLSLRLGVGRLKALRGPFSSTVVDLSLVFPFGVTSHVAR